MTETRPGPEKVTRKEDAPVTEATEATEATRTRPESERSRQQGASPTSSGRSPTGRQRSATEIGRWEVAGAAVLVVAMLASVVAGTQTARLWPWFVLAVLVALGIGALVLLRGRPPARTATEHRTQTAGAREETRPLAAEERAELAPFSVRTSLYSRHLLRILDRSRPHGQVVIPVSGGHRTQILVETSSDDPVELHDIRPVVVDRQPPRHGEPVVTAKGALPQQHFDLALDEDPPRLVPAEDREGVTPSLPITVAPRDMELVVLAPSSKTQEVAWHVELDWVCGDRSGTLTVDLGDHPFRVTAETGWTTFYPDGGPPVRTGWD
jgi:hypothetical protein